MIDIFKSAITSINNNIKYEDWAKDKDLISVCATSKEIWDMAVCHTQILTSIKNDLINSDISPKDLRTTLDIIKHWS